MKSSTSKTFFISLFTMFAVLTPLCFFGSSLGLLLDSIFEHQPYMFESAVCFGIGTILLFQLANLLLLHLDKEEEKKEEPANQKPPTSPFPFPSPFELGPNPSEDVIKAFLKTFQGDMMHGSNVNISLHTIDENGVAKSENYNSFEEYYNNNKSKTQSNSTHLGNNSTEELQKMLDKLVAEERYEAACQIREELEKRKTK